MVALFLAIGACLGWGVADVFGAIASRRIGASRASLLAYLIGVVGFALYIPFAPSHLPFWVIAVSALLGVILALALLTFNAALTVGNPSLVGTIASAFVAPVVVLSVIVFHQQVTVGEVLAVVTIFIGMLLSLLHDTTQRLVFDKGITLSLCTFAGWGIYWTFIKIPVHETSWFWPGYIATIAGFFTLLLINVRTLTATTPWRRGILPAVAAGIFGYGAFFCFNGALQAGSAVVAAPIAGSSPVLFVFLSSAIFHEPASYRQKVLSSTVGSEAWNSRDLKSRPH